MNQKVWEIGEEDWNRPSIPVRKDGPAADPRQGTVAQKSMGRSKNPALAFSLSMLFWGSGQLYFGRHRRGALFLTWMLLFGTLIALSALYGAPLARAFVVSGHQPLIITGIHLLLLAGPILGLGSAVDAYVLAQEAESEPFSGVEMAVWPVLGSLAFPGWGQFLNGQRWKGSFLLLFGVAGLFATLILWGCWDLFDLLGSDRARLVLEWHLIAALLLVPLALLAWIASIYDAFRVCREFYRKKGTLKNVGFRVWSKDILQALLPRPSAILGLLLAVSVAIQIFPRESYLDFLEQVRALLASQDLQILPELVRRVTESLGR